MNDNGDYVSISIFESDECLSHHFISEHYHNNISVLFSVEIMVRKIGEKES